MKSVRIIKHSNGDLSTLDVTVEGNKPRGWAIKKSTYQNIIKIKYTLTEETTERDEYSNFIRGYAKKPPSQKTKYRIHRFTIRNAIYGGRHKNLERKINQIYPKKFGQFVQADKEVLRAECPKYIITDADVSDVTIRRLR